MAKGRIRTTMQKDYFGTGNEKEITMDDGKVYRIRSTMQKDYFGNGQELEIYEVGENSGNEITMLTPKHSKLLYVLQSVFLLASMGSFIYAFVRIFSGKDCSLLFLLLSMIVCPLVFWFLAGIMGDLDYDLHEKRNDQ